jgi:phosphoglycolate phosphatase-like HAD superfamily hydrolase
MMIAVTWGFNTKEMLLEAEPQHIVHTPQELHQVLVSLTQEDPILVLHR